MLVLRIELLTGSYRASCYNDRERPEWPPAPARVFSAFVATLHEGEFEERHRSALQWLERIPAPAIHATEPVQVRSAMTVFVPVNDTVIAESANLLNSRERVRLAHAALLGVEDPKERPRLQTMVETARTRHRETSDNALAPVEFKEKAGKTAMSLLPESRGRQPRHFPAVSPPDPAVHLVWDQVPDKATRMALDELAAAIARIGHSSSLVHCRFVETSPEPNWVPDELHGTETIRVPDAGQLERLEQYHTRHQGVEPRVMPYPQVRYRKGGRPSETAEHPSNIAGEWMVFRRVGSQSFPSTRSVDIAQAFRKALIKYADQPVAEAISGHTPDGKRSENPRAFIVPLPFVGHRHADGRIMGVAVVLPTALPPEQRQEVLRAIGHWEEAMREEDEECPSLKVTFGKGCLLNVERIAWGKPERRSLRQRTWTQAATTWMSVTPVALDRNPGDLRSRDPKKAAKAFLAAESCIADACERIGLPRPATVTILPSVTFSGVEKAAKFPAYPPQADRVRRVKTHVCIEFDQPVSGPVVLGAGRYQGLGLFRPVHEEKQEQQHKEETNEHHSS